jgi:hypothetical protein
MRKSDWASLIVAGVLIASALFVLFVPIKAEPEVSRGEILQALANLIGAAIGTLGAYLVANWTLKKTDRDKKTQQADLAEPTYNALRTYFDEMDKSAAILEQFQGAKSEFPDLIGKFIRLWVEKRRLSDAIRNQLAISFPYIENEIDELIVSYGNWQELIKTAGACSKAAESHARFERSLDDAIDALSTASDARSNIVKRFQEAKRIIDRHRDWDEDVADAEKFTAIITALRGRIPKIPRI